MAIIRTTTSADVGGKYGMNVETLSANKTLTVNTDEIYQYLDEGGANRIITLATAGIIAGDRFVIRHNGVYDDTHYLEIKQSTTQLDKIYAGAIKEFIYNGSNWIAGEHGSGENGNNDLNVSIGSTANGYDGGVAIGSSTDAYTYGTAVGYNASGHESGVGIGASSNGYLNGVSIGRGSNAQSYGVALGYYAQGTSYGTALGYDTDTNDKKYSKALGYYSECERVGEFSQNINGDDADQENNIITQGWEVATANNTPVEMKAGGQAGERFTIRASSAVTFSILITARDNTAGHIAAYKFEGAIKRDGSNNTALVGTLTKDVIAEDDASWDVSVTADDANEALIITVTGDAANATQWAARAEIVETHF